MIKYWILLVMLIVHQTHQQAIKIPIDKSFQKFCDSVGGQRRVDVYSEKCDMKFQIPSTTQAEADLICKTWNAYHLLKATPDGKNTKCEFENLYECRDHFTQIRGMCYKLIIKDLTYTEASTVCINENAQIAKLPNYEMSRLFDSFFPDLTMFYIRGDPKLEEIHTFSGDGKGSNYALIYGLATAFRVGYNSIMKLEDKIKTNVMCAYKPPETLATLIMKAKAFEPYYYPLTADGKLTAIRTNNFYAPTELRGNPLSTHPNYKKKEFNEAGLRCQTSLKAIIGGTEDEQKERKIENTQTGDAFYPTTDNVKRLDPKTRSSSVYYHAALDRCTRPSTIHPNNPNTGRKTPGDITYFAGAGVETMSKRAQSGNKVLCEKMPQEFHSDYNAAWDPIHSNTAFLLMGQDVENKHIWKTEKDRLAPIMCRLEQQLILPNKCPDGYSLYDRPVTGQFVCHKYFPMKIEGISAHKKCQDLGPDTHLSSITDKKEYELLYNMAPLVTWIGLYNREGCRYRRQYNSVPEGTCSIEDAYFWLDDLLGDNEGRKKAGIVRELWALSGMVWSDQAWGVTISNKDPDPKRGGLHKDGIWPREPDRQVPYLCATLARYEKY